MNAQISATVRLIEIRDQLAAELAYIKLYLNWPPVGSPAKKMVWQDWCKTRGRLVRMNRRIAESLTD